MSDVSTATKLIPTVNEGFLTTLGVGGVLSGGAAVPLSSTTGLTNGSTFVGIIEPGQSKQQVFTGVVDTGGSQITDVVWTRGTDVDHLAGVTIVDYVTGTHFNLLAKGFAVGHTQAGLHTLGSNDTLTAAKFITALNDTNGNELLKLTATASAVNEITVANAATGNNPFLIASGGDTNIHLRLQGKGTGGVYIDQYVPYKISVYRNSAWTSGNNAFAKVVFDSEEFDTGSNFATGTFTAPVAGFYTFGWCVTAAVASGGAFRSALYKNGSPFKDGSGAVAGGANDVGKSSGSCMIQLSATDTIDIYYYGTGGAGSTGAAATYLTGFLMSKV